MAPQLIVIGLAIFALSVGLAQHGQPEKGTKSFPRDFVAVSILQALLYWGGFYDQLIARLF